MYAWTHRHKSRAQALGMNMDNYAHNINTRNSSNTCLFSCTFCSDKDLIKTATDLLGKFVSSKDSSNVRYLALAALSHLASLGSETATLVKKHQATVIVVSNTHKFPKRFANLVVPNGVWHVLY